MIEIALLFCPPFPGPAFNAPAVRQSFELVNQLGSAEPIDRQRIHKQLTERPEAVWAVLWGTRHKSPSIAIACSEIIQEWAWRTRLAEMVRSVDGDFDRFLNSLLYSPARDVELFAAASQKGRALDRYYVRKSFLTDPKGFPTLAQDWNRWPAWATPFHDFAAYLRGMQPGIFPNRLLQVPAGQTKPWLAKCDAVDTDSLVCSIVLSEGNVKARGCGNCIVVSGSDVSIDHGGISSSLIIAAGDVRVKRSATHSFVIAGGKVTVEPNTDMTKMFLISPGKTMIAGARWYGPQAILDGAPKPAPELFTFAELGREHGLEAALEQGRVRITKVMPAGPMARFFQENDIALARGETKIESPAQFRRLLRHARDTGRLEFRVERGGQERTIKANLKQAADSLQISPPSR
jgi:hypothetical protein